RLGRAGVVERPGLRRGAGVQRGPGVVGPLARRRRGGRARRGLRRGPRGARARGGWTAMTNGDHPTLPSLEVDLNGLRFATPVLAASGCFNAGREMADLVDLSRIGGIVTKSVTLNPRKGMPVPRMAETASGMLNAIGLQNVGVTEFRAKEAPWI